MVARYWLGMAEFPYLRGGLVSLKQDAADRLDGALVRAYRLERMSHFVWVVEAVDT